MPKHSKTRIPLIAMLAGWTSACGGSDAGSEGTSGTAMGLPIVTALEPAPRAPFNCSTPDGSPELPDGVSAALAQPNTWPNAIVPFRFHESAEMAHGLRASIDDAIRDFNYLTAARFFHDANETQAQHVLFTTDRAGCFSGRNDDADGEGEGEGGIGYEGGGAHVINLELGLCDDADSARHELGHRVGLHHEQRRPDRDQFIRIQTANIHEGRRHDFDLYVGPGYAYGGFDFESMMLYPSKTNNARIAIDTEKPIITLLDGTEYPEPSGDLSNGDIATLFSLYPPPPVVPNTNNTCLTAPVKRSRLPNYDALSFRRSDLIAISDSATTTTFSHLPSSGASFGPASSWA